MDALYVRLLEGERECRTVRLSEDVALNMGDGETLVGIEILDAKELLGGGQVPAAIAGIQRGLQGMDAGTGEDAEDAFAAFERDFEIPEEA